MSGLGDRARRWWWIPPAAAASLIFVWWLAGRGNTNQVIATLTFALVAITFWYAFHTREMVAEMRQTREQDLALRRREKSEAAATAALDAIQHAREQIEQRGPAGVEPTVYRNLQRQLRNHAALITDDDELKDHLHACSQVAFVAGFDEQAMRTERINPGVVRLRCWEIIQATERALIAYVTGQPRGAWHWDASSQTGQREQLPTAAEAGAWIRNRARIQEDK